MFLAPRDIRKLYGRFDARNIRFASVTLVEAMDLFRGLTPDDHVTVLTRTEAREVRRAGTPFPIRGCYVVKRRIVTLNKPYEEAVNERRAKEKKPQDFKAKARSWGERIERPFVLHGGPGKGWRLYLSLSVVQTLGREYYSEKGERLTEEQVRPYLKPYNKKTRQGVSRPVIYRDYELPHVLAMTIRGPRGGEAGYVVDLKGLYASDARQKRLALVGDPFSAVSQPKVGRIIAKQEAVRLGKDRKVAPKSLVRGRR